MPVLRDNASKNLHFLVVVASLLAKGSVEGVRKSWPRSVGAIAVVGVDVYIIIRRDFWVLGVLARARRIRSTPVDRSSAECVVAAYV